MKCLECGELILEKGLCRKCIRANRKLWRQIEMDNVIYGTSYIQEIFDKKRGTIIRRRIDPLTVKDREKKKC